MVHCIKVVGYETNEYIDDYFKTYAFRSTYNHPQFPIPYEGLHTLLSSTPIINAPVYKCDCGKLVTSMIESNSRGFKKARTCSCCKQVEPLNRTANTILRMANSSNENGI